MSKVKTMSSAVSGRAVGEFGLGAQAEGDRAAVAGHFGRTGDEAVDRIRLVQRRRHQRVVEMPQPLRGVALQNEVVEAVEGGAGGGADHGQAAALRGVGVHPFEMLEVGGVFELPEGRQTVPAVVGGGARRGEDKTGQHQRRLRDLHERCSRVVPHRQVSRRGGLAPRIGEPLGRRFIVPPHPQEGAVARGQLVRAAKHVP